MALNEHIRVHIRWRLPNRRQIQTSGGRYRRAISFGAPPYFFSQFLLHPSTWFKNWRRVTHDIPRKEGVTTVCNAYEDFYGEKAPIPTKYLREILYFILTENSFKYYGSNYLETHGTVMGTKSRRCFC